MVANFVNLADNKFTLNGIEYHKNYAPVQVNQSDSQVRVISAYDSRFALVPPTHYSEYTVNGITYTSVESLIRALVDVVFSKFTLDGVAKEFQDSVLQYMDDIQTDVTNFKGDVNQDLQQITAEKQVFESEAQEIKDAVANMTTTGKIYDSLADAIAESPKPADGTPFSVMGDGDNDGYYKFDSTQPDGVKFGRKFDRRLQVSNIDILRTYIGRPGEAVDVLGYYEEGDGGGGLFYWDGASTEDDNGGTVIETNNSVQGRWKRRIEGTVNVKCFGARGDNTEDASEAFQNAINASLEVFIPEGDFKILNPLLLRNGSNLTASDGTRITEIGSAGLLVISGVTGARIENLHTSHPHETGQALIEIDSSEKISFLDCHFDGGSRYDPATQTMSAGFGQIIRIGSGCQGVVIDSSVIRGARGNHGVQMRECDDVKVLNCTISETRRAGVSINSGSSNIMIYGNTLFNNQKDFLHDGAIDVYGYLPHCYNVTIEGNTIYSTGDGVDPVNCHIRMKDGYSFRVANNTLIADTPIFASIYLQRREEGSTLADVTIEGNIFSVETEFLSGYCIRIQPGVNTPVNNVQIIKNTFKGGEALTDDSSFNGPLLEVRNRVVDLTFSNNNIDFPLITNTIFYLYNTSSGEDVFVYRNVFITGNIIRSGGPFVLAFATDSLFIRDNIHFVSREIPRSISLQPPIKNSVVVYNSSNTTDLPTIIDSEHSFNNILDNNIKLI